MGYYMDRRIIIFVGSLLIILALAGCSFNLQEMNLPFMPTITSTLVPTPLPTATPTLLPKASKTEGVIQTEINTDGSTRLTDTELGYSITFPAQWLILGIDQDVQAQLAATFNDEIPENLLTSAQALTNISGIRAAALDYSGYFSDVEGVNTNVVIRYKADSRVLEEEFSTVIDNEATVMPTQVPNANVIYQVVATNANGVEYGKLVITHPKETFGLPIRQITVILRLDGGLLTISGTTPEEDYSRLETSFQRVVDSIEITGIE